MSVVSESLTGKSLLEVVETRFQDSNRQETVTRVVLSASFGEGSSAEKVSSLAQDAKQEAEKVDAAHNSKITGGLIVISNSSIATILEAPPKKIYSILNAFASSPLLSKVRILANVEDAPTRSFEHFGCYSANPPSEGDVDVSAEGPVSVASDILAKFQSNAFPEAGSSIVALSKTGFDVPSASRISSCSDCSAFPTLTEYLELFASPVSVEVESEMVWPLGSAVSWN